jgi:acetolactate synthase I/III small subunit
MTMTSGARHTIVALVEDHPGVLNRIVSLFRRRNFNIESLAVGHTEIAGISRMTIVVSGSDPVVEQVSKQLYKVIEVLKVTDVTHEKAVNRELALVKVTSTGQNRAEIMQLVDIFRAKIVDVAADSVMVEITGPESKVDSLLSLLRPFGIKEMVRTGRVSMMRGVAGEIRAPADDLDGKRLSNGGGHRLPSRHVVVES